MINQLVSNALVEWLTSETTTGPLSGVTWMVEDQTDVKVWPLGIVHVTGSQKFPVMRGNYEMTVSCSLETLPEDIDEVEAATMKSTFYALLGDHDRIVSGLDNRTDLLCREVEVMSQSTTPEDGRRRDDCELYIVAGAQV